MSDLYRYKPADNRTPVHHPTIGHLEYGDVYEHPDCADNPDFELVTAQRKPRVHDDEPTPVAETDPVSAAEPGTPENPIVAADDPEPPAKPADAAKGGRSKS